MEHWKNAIWSNKSSFTLFPTSDRICIRRTPSHIYDPECLPLRTWRWFIHGMRTHVVVFCRTHHDPASLPVGLHRWQRQCEHFERWSPSHGANSSLMVMLFIKMITLMFNSSHYPELLFWSFTSNRSSTITWSPAYSALVVGAEKIFSITLITSIIIKGTCHCFTRKMGQDSLKNYTGPLFIHFKNIASSSECQKRSCTIVKITWFLEGVYEYMLSAWFAERWS